MVNPYESTRGVHDHEWMLDQGFPAEFDGDYVYVYEHCDWVEVTGTYTDSARDEVYESTGMECNSTRTTTFVLDSIVREDGTSIDSVDDETAEAVEVALVDRFEHDSSFTTDVESVVVEWWSYHGGVDRDDKQVYVEADGDSWYATFTFESKDVSEDW